MNKTLQEFQEWVSIITGDERERAMIYQSLNYEIREIDSLDITEEEKEKERLLVVDSLLGYMKQYHSEKIKEFKALENVFNLMSV